LFKLEFLRIACPQAKDRAFIFCLIRMESKIPYSEGMPHAAKDLFKLEFLRIACPQAKAKTFPF